jgi:hypothetical protein
VHHNTVKLISDLEGIEFSFVKRSAPGQDYQVRASPSAGLLLSSGRRIFCIDMVGSRHPFEDGATELVDANLDTFEEAFLDAAEHVRGLMAQPHARVGGRF